MSVQDLLTLIKIDGWTSEVISAYGGLDQAERATLKEMMTMPLFSQ